MYGLHRRGVLRNQGFPNHGNHGAEFSSSIAAMALPKNCDRRTRSFPAKKLQPAGNGGGENPE